MSRLTRYNIIAGAMQALYSHTPSPIVYTSKLTQNQLSAELWAITSKTIFHNRLKTHLFSELNYIYLLSTLSTASLAQSKF